MQQPRPRIPRSVIALGFVSLFMDMSSELIHSLMPLFLVGTLGASMQTLGAIEGLAEAMALVVKVFSGSVSDFMGKRKPLLLAGYGLAALSKPLFPLAHSANAVLAARLIDRFGKGIRGAPRDALIADVAPEEIRGACFGLRQSMDTVGAFIGPLFAILLMVMLRGNLRAALWWAVIPTAFAVMMILFGVEEPDRHTATERKSVRNLFRTETVRQFTAAYWAAVGINAVFTLARFSEAFLVLKARGCGLTPTWVPSVMVAMSLVYSIAAYPAGIFADRYGRKGLLAAGMLCLIFADLILARANSVSMLMAGVSLWGLHMGFTQGAFAAMVAQHSPKHLKGSAFGIFNLVSGVFMLASSLIAGSIWDRYGAGAAFNTGALFAAISLLSLGILRAD